MDFDVLQVIIIGWNPKEVGEYDTQAGYHKFQGYIDMEYVFYFCESRLKGFMDVSFANGEVLTLDYDLDLFALKYTAWKKHREQLRILTQRPN